MPVMNIPSACTIASIALNDGMILPYDANPSRMEFSEGTPPENEEMPVTKIKEIDIIPREAMKACSSLTVGMISSFH